MEGRWPVGIALDPMEITLRSDSRVDEGDAASVDRKVIYPCFEGLFCEVMKQLNQRPPAIEVFVREGKGTKARVRIVNEQGTSGVGASNEKILDSGYHRSAKDAIEFVVRDAVAWLEFAEGVEIIDASSRWKERSEELCEELYGRVEMMVSSCSVFVCCWEHARTELDDVCRAWAVGINKRRCRDMTVMPVKDLACDLVDRLFGIVDKYGKHLETAKKELLMVTRYKETYLAVAINNHVKSQMEWRRRADISGTFALEQLVCAIGGAKLETECVPLPDGRFAARVRILFTEGTPYFPDNLLDLEGAEMLSEELATEDAAQRAVQFIQERMLVYMWDINHGYRFYMDTQLAYLNRLQQKMGELLEDLRHGWTCMIKEVERIQRVFGFHVNALRHGTDTHLTCVSVEERKRRLRDVLFRSLTARRLAEASVNNAFRW
ncbi:hypothetical protein ACP4OV_018072 [Aristida adscensionis]